LEENMNTVTQLMIGKYMTPELSTNEVTAAAPSEVPTKSQSAAIPLGPKPDAKPTCPYCGRSLTHDRSRCPMIRAKDPNTIEQRIAELKQHTAEGTDNVGAHAIEVLENALLRKQGVNVKKKASSNVSSDDDSRKINQLCQVASSVSVKPVPPAKPLSTVDKTSSTTMMTPAVPPSSFSPGFPEGNGRLQKANTTRKSPSYEPASRVSPSQKSSFPSLVSQIFPRQTLEDMPAADSKSQSQDSSDAESSDAESSYTRAQEGSSVSDSGEDSNEESSSEDETTSTLHPSRQLDPICPVNVSGYSDKDLEAVIRGPGTPLKPTEWPSSESSEDEEAEDIRTDDSPEEGQEIRRSLEPQKLYVLRNKSSDEEVGDNDGSESDSSEDKTLHTSRNHKPMASVPPIVAHAEIQDGSREIHPVPLPVPKEHFQPPQGGASFQEINQRLGSVESDKGGNDAFEQALEEENTVLGLAQQGPSHPSAKEVASQSPRISPEPDQSGGVEVKESDPTESEANSPEKKPSEVEEAEPAQVTGSDPIEASKTLDPYDSHARQGSLIEDYESPTPALPLPGSSIAEPERAATPKPGIFHRMKSHLKLAREEQTSSLNLNSNLTVAPSAKPRSRAAVKRSEQSELGKEDQDVPPRRSARVPARKAVDNPQPPVTSLPNGSQPLAKKTQQVRAMPRNQDAGKPSRPETKKQTRGTQNMKKGVAKGAAKSPTPFSPEEDMRSSVVESQATELAQEVRFPPSSSVSLGAWETMRSGTSVGHIHSDVMIDELQSDADTILPIPFPLKPQSQHKSASQDCKKSPSGPKADHNTEVRGKGEVMNNNPLFILSESQTAFPHSQFQSQLPDPRESTSSGSEEELREIIIKKHSVKQHHPAQYRPLSDIAGEASKLFTPKVLRQSIGLRATDRVPKQRKERLSQMYGKMGVENIDDGSDDDTGKESESDAEISHIPKSRKAGARLKGRMSV